MNIPLNKQVRLLTELFSCYEGCWRVVGITEAAFIAIKNADYRLPKGVTRAHLVKRFDTYTTMLKDPLMDLDTWWAFYLENDRTVLATSAENSKSDRRGLPIQIKYEVPAGLFPSRGFGPRFGKEERAFLRSIR
jgi:hypothetical protein